MHLLYYGVALAILHSGCRVLRVRELWQVRVQLYRGSPTPVASSGAKCLPFKKDDALLLYGGGPEEELWENGCVQDPTSPLYQRCAVEVDEDARPEHTEYCTNPAQHMTVRIYMRINMLFLPSSSHVFFSCLTDGCVVSSNLDEVRFLLFRTNLPTVGKQCGKQ